MSNEPLSIQEYLEQRDKPKAKRSKAAWREIDGKRIYFRSKWEANYARFLTLLKLNSVIKDWEHEPQTFWFEQIRRGVRSYLPDFKVFLDDNTHYWIEVKGFMDSRSNTKLKRFAKYYPGETIKVIGKEWFYQNNKKLKSVITDWE